jgi:cellulose biosynthesis protein BcsQ
VAIIAIVGRKGGIGKSTIAGNLAAELTEMGWCVVALDPDQRHSVLSRKLDKVLGGDGAALRCQCTATRQNRRQSRGVGNANLSK